MKEGRGSVRLVYVVAFMVVVFDQLAKLWVRRNFALNSVRPVVDGVFNLTFIRNDGAAFGVLRGNNLFFIVLSLLAVAVIIALGGRYGRSTVIVKLGVGLILGGAGGNLIDRFLHGHVIDFLDFYVGSWHWPAFNLADSSICTGVALLVLFSMQGRHV
jgi:signal peptidase II